jgi:hypothetical protein
LTFINSFLLLQLVYTQILVLIAIESGPDPNPIYHLALTLDGDSPLMELLPSLDATIQTTTKSTLRSNLIFLQTNKPITAATMTRTPGATPRPIETPLFEPDLLPFGTEEVVGVEFGVEVGVEGVEVATEVKYGAIITASWKPSFSSQNVEFCDPQHQNPSRQVRMFIISVEVPPFYISMSNQFSLPCA